MADKKKFKPHKMYCKDGSKHFAKTYQQHLKLDKQGCGHKPFKMDPESNGKKPGVKAKKAARHALQTKRSEKFKAQLREANKKPEQKPPKKVAKTVAAPKKEKYTGPGSTLGKKK
jgi:hypothetical protein